MRVKFDPQVDMAYVYLVPIREGRVTHTEPLVINLPGGLRRLINLDFDQQGRLLGIEIDGALSTLPQSVLDEASSSDIPGR